MGLKIGVICVLSYLIGAIPFAYIFVKLIKKIDLRTVGSGNVGATNAMRVLGWKLGLLVLLADFLKGFVVVSVISKLFGTLILWDAAPNMITIIAGMFGIIGHIWTVFLKFKGGKGVATSAGVFCYMLPIPFVISLGIFILLVSIFKYVSLGSVSAAIVFPIVTYFMVDDWDFRYFTMILGILIVVKHFSNLKRLVQGVERKINFGSSGKSR